MTPCHANVVPGNRDGLTQFKNKKESDCKPFIFLHNKK
jgi:hypothetical protein